MPYFYYYFRPWVVIVKFLGIFPLDNVLSSDPKKLKFQKFGWSRFYSLCIFMIICSLVLSFSGTAFHVTSNREMCLQLVVVLSALRSFWSLAVFTRDAQKLPVLINLLHSYDKKQEEYRIVKKSSISYNILKWMILPIILSFSICGIYTFLSGVIVMEILVPDIKFTKYGFLSSTCFGLLSIWYTYPLSLYIYLSCKIIDNFNNLNETLLEENIIGNYLGLETNPMTFETISKYRYLHNILSDCVHHLEYAYGSALAVDQICVVGIAVVNLTVYTFIAWNDFFVLAMTAVSVFLAILVIIMSEKIKEEGNEIVNIIHRMPTKSISEDCLKEGMSEYDRIRRACLKRGELWEDPDFPASQSSVFYHQTPPFQFIWKRPKDLCNRPNFIQDAPTTFDITSGKMGDRWLVSCLGILYLNKGLFYRVVPADQTFFGDQYCGVFRFRLWWCGEWTEVLVDDRLPTVQGKLAFLQSQSDNFWPGLLEKAYAKLHGSYEALKYGSLLDGLADLTGGLTESIPIRQDTTSCARLLYKLLDMTSIVTCTIQTTNQVRSQTTEKLSNGVHTGINYRLQSIERTETFNGEGIQLVKLKNPLERSPENTSPIPVDSPEWSDISPQELDRMESKLQEGEFWLPFSQFVKTFTHLEVVHLDSDTSRDEPSLHNKNTWQMRLFQGHWQKGVSAGGCRNNPDTFHINPQLQLLLSEMEEVIVSLNQHSIMEPKVIGFTSYLLSKNTNETIGKNFFKKNKSMFNSQYTNSRQVSHRCQLEQGGYLIIPTTFEPSQESGFTLRVFSCKSLKLKLLDTVPQLLKSAIVKAPPLLDGKSFSQYEAVFLQLADEHRTVNAFELQELLDACLPNDYIKSCASIEVCRQIILTFEISGIGRLKFSDFKDLMCSLKFWQTAFKNHTKEKTGILKAERLRDALLEVGFQLSSDILATLILRYMRKDGTLRFGDFVSALLHLTVSFSIFEAKDPLQNGSIKLSLSEWLKSSLTC